MCNSKAKTKQTNKKQTKKTLGLVFKIQDDIWGKYTSGEVPGRPMFKKNPPFEVHGEGWGNRWRWGSLHR